MPGNVCRMNDHLGEAGKKGVPELDREYLEDFVSLLETADTGGAAGEIRQNH